MFSSYVEAEDGVVEGKRERRRGEEEEKDSKK